MQPIPQMNNPFPFIQPIRGNDPNTMQIQELTKKVSQLEARIISLENMNYQYQNTINHLVDSMRWVYQSIYQPTSMSVPIPIQPTTVPIMQPKPVATPTTELKDTKKNLENELVSIKKKNEGLRFELEKLNGQIGLKEKEMAKKEMRSEQEKFIIEKLVGLVKDDAVVGEKKEITQKQQQFIINEFSALETKQVGKKDITSEQQQFIVNELSALVNEENSEENESTVLEKKNSIIEEIMKKCDDAKSTDERLEAIKSVFN